MKRMHWLTSAMALWSTPGLAETTAPAWTPAQIAQLRQWNSAAPEDALPVLETAALDAAQRTGDQAALAGAASALALRLARMHMVGCCSAAERAGWRIDDPDAHVDLAGRLAQALASGNLDPFFTGLRPAHPDYAALRATFGLAKNPAHKATLARNMERWRWMPQSLGDSYVLVNAAAFEARLWRHGRQAGTWRVIVGKPSTPTPVFSATITGVTFNPWWDVPASIVRESVGALVRRSPGLARQRGYVWSGGHIRQRPGPGNALGQVKIEMPNPYKVYMHDTPTKNLFEREVRAFSHGCIRTQDVLGLALTLLDGKVTRSEAEAKIASRRNETVSLPSHVPVYVTYFTASVRADGGVAIYPDVYGRDGRLGDMTSARDACSA